MKELVVRFKIFISQCMIYKACTDMFLCFFSNPAIGSDGLCCQSREVKEWHGCRATKGLMKGMQMAILLV